MASRRVLVVILVMAVTNSLNALTYNGVPEYEAGSGSNSTLIVVDFDFGNNFIFEYNWDGAATGYDALAAIAGAGALDFETAYGGTFITDLLYPGGIKHDYGTMNTSWAYYTSSNGENWTYSMVGAADRILNDNCWDSWVWTSYSGGPYGWDNADRIPGAAAVPEPVTVSLMAVGLICMKRRKSFCA